MNKEAQPLHEARPATLQFRDGAAAGTIYVRKVGGRIVEAYRGYDYGYNPLAPALRSDPSGEKKT